MATNCGFLEGGVGLEGKIALAVVVALGVGIGGRGGV
jgi:hypothetical protein